MTIKRDLFAKDIAYDGHSESHLGKLSEREKSTKAKTMHLAAEVISEDDETYRKTLEQFHLVRPLGDDLRSGEGATMAPVTGSGSKRQMNHTQKSSRTVA